MSSFCCGGMIPLFHKKGGTAKQFFAGRSKNGPRYLSLKGNIVYSKQ
jgi:hypothetical protein